MNFHIHKRQNSSLHQKFSTHDNFTNQHLQHDKENLKSGSESSEEYAKYLQQRQMKKRQEKCVDKAKSIVMKEALRNIVAQNVPYFRNIIELNLFSPSKPNSHSLKLPFRTTESSYKNQFAKRSQYQLEKQFQTVDFRRQNMSKMQQVSDANVSMQTTYQNQFQKFADFMNKKKEIIKERQYKFKEQFKRNDAPGFLDTHNNMEYRDWGTGSVMPSMKPSPRAATLKMPFKAKSMYRTQFHQVILPETKKVPPPEETFPQPVNLWMGDSSYKKSYRKEKCFSKQQHTFKPIEACGSTNLPFKSSTQYKESFLQQILPNNNKQKNKNKLKKCPSSKKQLSNSQILNLVMRL